MWNSNTTMTEERQRHLEADKHLPLLDGLLLGEEPLLHHGAQHLQENEPESAGEW